jgi:cobalt-zinc-cadmium resistance protein CzcA
MWCRASCCCAKGADSDSTLEGIHAKVEELNNGILPPGVKVVPFLDRSDLVHYTTHTVLHNLTEGIILVVVVLFLFLGNVRGALIVALTIPFSLLFAATCLDLKHIPANLLSLGALDFGMVVDGAVVMVENIVRHLSHHDQETDTRTPMEKIREAHEVQRPVFYAIGIIITAYLPIFTLQRVEGRLFKPMAWTVAFALLGALMFSMLLAPVLASLFFPKGTKEWHNPVMTFLTATYRTGAAWAIRWRWVTLGGALAGFAFFVYLATGCSAPSSCRTLDEGAIWVRGTLAPSTGQDRRHRLANRRASSCAPFRKSRSAPARWAVPTTAPIPPASSTPSISSI